MLSACASKRRPNILFIMTDDQTVNEMSCAGNRILKTPNIDRIADEGVRFSNAFVTNSLCAPSRATALTGCYSHIHGVKGNSEMKGQVEKINPAIPTYPQLLQKAGYKTAVVGKWHLQDDPKGFDYSCVLPGQGVYDDPEFIENGVRRKIAGYATDITTDLALGFLAKVGKDPFCLLYQHKAPHRPFKPAARHQAMFEKVEIPYPDTFNDEYATRRLAKEAEDMRFDVSLAGDYKDLPANFSPENKKKWLFQRMVKDHYRAVLGVDENLGRVLKYLDDSGLAKDTLILYTSDNGYFLGEHGWYDKRFMYEPSLRVPLLMRYPNGFRSGALDDHMVLNIDIAPTILDFAGVPAPATMQGRSLRPLLEGNPPNDWRTSIYYSYHENSWALANKDKDARSDPSFEFFTPHRVGPHRGIRTSRHKLIEYYGEDMTYWELFDLESDANELKNLYENPTLSPVTYRLKQELSALRAEYKDNG